MDQEHIPKALAAVIAAGALAYGAKKMYDKHKKNKVLKKFGIDPNNIKDNKISKHDHMKDDYDTYRDIADMYASRDYK